MPWAGKSAPILSPQETAPKKSVKEVHGSLCEETLEWLEKSIVCTSTNPMDPDYLVTHLKYQVPSLSRFTDMGKFMFNCVIV